MDNQAFKEQRSQIMAEIEQFYVENPEVGNLVHKKRLLRRIVVIFWVLHTVFSLLLMAQIQTLDGMEAAKEIFKLLFQLLWLFAFMSPEGGWRIHLILYFWSLANFGMLFMNYSDMIATLPYVATMPLLGVVMFMEVVVPFLLLGVALYFTLPASHRCLSEEAEMNRKAASEKMRQLMQ